jgi:hypothetical protein
MTKKGFPVLKPFVTALIDTYNHERFIEEAVVSVVAQDFPAEQMEIIVVDDGSTDRTPEIVRMFEPRVRLIRKPNGGQASAFNTGIQEARGNIVAFLDGDDWWASNKLHCVAEAFARHLKVGIVGHSITEVLRGGGQRIEEHREETSFQADSLEGARLFRTRKNFLGTSRMTIRTELLRQIVPIPEGVRIQADEFLFTMAAVLSRAIILPETLTFYRQHDSNLFMISADDSAKACGKLDALQALSAALSERLSQHNIQADVRKAIVEAIELEAGQLRLSVVGGYSWETVATELGLLRVLHGDASLWQQLFSCARILPAIAIPPRAYYRWRQRLTQAAPYQRMRRRYFPFPVPSHVHRKERPTP